jgi:hypothetical protein
MSWWGVRVLTGPDSWWLGDARGPYAMDQSTAQKTASGLNIHSNEVFFLVKVYRDKNPHYRYAAAPLRGVFPRDATAHASFKLALSRPISYKESRHRCAPTP